MDRHSTEAPSDGPGERSPTIPEPPVIRATLELQADFLHALREADQLAPAVVDAVEHALERLCDTLGIPGCIVVSLGELDAECAQWIRLTIDDRLCRYPDDALHWAYGYVSDSVVSATQKAADLSRALTAAITSPFKKQRSVVAEFFAIACTDIVQRQPSILFGQRQLTAYLAQLPAEPPALSRRGARQAALASLQALLDLRLSLANVERIAQGLQEFSELRAPIVVEELVDALRPDTIEIRLPAAYLAQLRRLNSRAEFDLLLHVRGAMFEELGALYPSFRIVEDDTLAAQHIAFTINHLATTPMRGLSPDELLVNDMAERLSQYGAVSALNPATWQPACIVAASHKSKLEAQGLTCWDAWGNVLLCLAAMLRQLGDSFVHRPLVQYRLEQLAQVYPCVVEQVRARYGLEDLTRVLRLLAREQVSTQNMHRICERLLDAEYTKSSAARYLILDDRITPRPADFAEVAEPGFLLRFVREGLRAQLSHKYSHGTNTIVVYLLDEAMEQPLLFASADQVSELHKQQILVAIREELRYLPRTAQTPHILTYPRVRSVLRDITRVTFPNLVVIAFDEISATMNIQPIARIALSA